MLKRATTVVLIVTLMFSYQQAEAFSLKKFFNNIFEKSTVTNQLPLSANALDATSPKSLEPQIIETETTTETVTESTTKEIVSTPTDVVEPVVTTFKVLKYGMTNDKDVAMMQLKLIKLGYLKEGNATGNFASLTLAAVQMFQKAYGLTVTGIVDEKTSQTIDRALIQSPKPSPSTTILPIVTLADPSLTISISSSTPHTQYLPAGATDVKFVEYDLKATNGDITVVQLLVSGTGYGSFNILRNLKLVGETGQFGTTIPVPPGNGIPSNPYAYFNGSLIIPAGKTKKISIYGDIAASAPAGSVIVLQIAGNQVSSSGVQTSYSGQPTSNPFIVTTQSSPKILVLGGRNQNGTFNDVYSSNDMLVWNTASVNGATPKWTARGGIATAYFNNRYWVIGGDINTNDIWSSVDGISWTQSPAPDMTNYSEFQAAVVNGKMYIVGGRRANGNLPNQATVWSTSDGVSWQIEAANATFGPRNGYSLVGFDGKLYVMGGYDGITGGLGSQSSDVWMSNGLPQGCTTTVGYSTITGQSCSVTVSLGSTWTKIKENAIWGPLARAKALSYNGKIYLLGGEKMVGNFIGRSNKIWTSTNGVDWTQLNAMLPTVVTTANSIDITVANGKLWMSDNQLLNGSHNRLWSSTDAITWTLISTNTPWSPRYGYSMVGK